MKKIKSIITIIFLALIMSIVILYNDAISDFIISNFIYTNVSTNYTFNEYSKRDSYNYVQIVDDFTVDSKEDLINIIYTIVDSGASTFTFYCSSEYPTCINDVVKLSSETDKLTVLNNFVHPYNSYSKLYLSTNNLGKITLNVEKLYSYTDIKYIEEEIKNIENKNINSSMSIEEKIKVFHDYIVNNTTYDEERADLIKNNAYMSNDVQSHKANGLLSNHLALCSGYTDIMSIYLNRIGIKNYKIANSTHIWNAIYINNKWQHLDLTWDDPVTSSKKPILLHEFFLIDTVALQKLDATQHNFETDIYSEFTASN